MWVNSICRMSGFQRRDISAIRARRRARLVLAHLAGQGPVGRGDLVAIHHANLAEDFVELGVVHRLVGFAHGGQEEVHAAGERAA